MSEPLKPNRNNVNSIFSPASWAGYNAKSASATVPKNTSQARHKPTTVEKKKHCQLRSYRVAHYRT